MYQNDDLKEADAFMGIGVKWLFIAVIGLSLFGWWLSTIGLFGSTVVERKVFENSYQYSEARKSEIATMEAQLVEIDAQLSNPDIDDATRRALESQKSVIKVRLSAAKSKNENVLLK